MTSPAERKLVWTVGLVAAALMLIVLVLSFSRGRSRAAPSLPTDGEVARSPVSRAAPTVVRPAERPRPPSTESGKPLPPVIDEILVEKEEVCEGEENLITVKAHTLDGADSLLHGVIGSERGMSVPLKTYLDARGQPLHQYITVFGNRNVSTRVEVPPYKVKQCAPDRVVYVTAQTRANRIHEFELTAKLVDNAKAKPFKPRQYLWDFGDGDSEVTTAGYAIHAYQHGVQKSLYSNYLLRVEVVAESGESAVGRTSLQFYNLGYEHLIKFGTVSLVAQGTPRFPAMDERGMVRQKFEIWHAYDQPVEIQKVTLVRHDSTGRRTDDKQVDLARLFNETEISPGKSIEAELSFDSKQYPENLLAVVYRLEGTSADGRKAIGEISVMKPPTRPTRENSKAITDPKMLAKVQKALELLGQDTVTQEDLSRLEREGKLP
jgi:hypothetical protein